MILQFTEPTSNKTYLVQKDETVPQSLTVTSNIAGTEFKWLVDGVEVKTEIGQISSHSITLSAGVTIVHVEGWSGGFLEEFVVRQFIVSDAPQAAISGDHIYYNDPDQVQLSSSNSFIGVEEDDLSEYLLSKTITKKGYLEYYMQLYPTLGNGIVILCDLNNKYIDAADYESKVGIAVDYYISSSTSSNGWNGLDLAMKYLESLGTDYTHGNNRSTIILSRGDLICTTYIRLVSTPYNIENLTIVGEPAEVLQDQVYTPIKVSPFRYGGDWSSIYGGGVSSGCGLDEAWNYRGGDDLSAYSAFNFKNFKRINICNIDFKPGATYGGNNHVTDNIYARDTIQLVKCAHDASYSHSTAKLVIDGCSFNGRDTATSTEAKASGGGSVVVDHQCPTSHLSIVSTNNFGLVPRAGLIKIFNRDIGKVSVDITNGMFYVNDDPKISQELVKFQPYVTGFNKVNKTSPTPPGVLEDYYEVSIKYCNFFYKLSRAFDRTTATLVLDSNLKAGDTINVNALWNYPNVCSDRKYSFFNRYLTSSDTVARPDRSIPEYFWNDVCTIVIPASYQWGPSVWAGPIAIKVDCSTIQDDGDNVDSQNGSATVQEVGAYGTGTIPEGLKINGVYSQIYFSYNLDIPEQAAAMRKHICNLSSIQSIIATDTSFKQYAIDQNWVLQPPGIQWVDDRVAYSYDSGQEEWYTGYAYTEGGYAPQNASAHLTDSRLMPNSPLIGTGEDGKNIGLIPFQIASTDYSWSEVNSTTGTETVLSIEENLDEQLPAGTYDIKFEITKNVPSVTGFQTQTSSANKMIYVAQAPTPVITFTEDPITDGFGTYYLINSNETTKSIIVSSINSLPGVGTIAENNRKWYIDGIYKTSGTVFAYSNLQTDAITELKLEITNSLGITIAETIDIGVYRTPDAIITSDSVFTNPGGAEPVTCHFSATNSIIDGPTPITYQWYDVTGGGNTLLQTTTDEEVDLDFNTGVFVVKLVVTDQRGQTDFVEKEIQVNAYPEAIIDSSTTPRIVSTTEGRALIEFNADSSDVGAGTIDIYEWSIDGQVKGNEHIFSWLFWINTPTTVGLKITNSYGLSNETSFNLEVFREPVAVITAEDYTIGAPGATIIDIEVSASDSLVDGTATYVWRDVTGGGSVLLDTTTNTETTISLPTGQRIVELEITDSRSQVATTTKELGAYPQLVADAGIDQNYIINWEDPEWDAFKKSIILDASLTNPLNIVSVFKWYYGSPEEGTLLAETSQPTAVIELPIGEFNITLLAETSFGMTSTDVMNVKIEKESVTPPIADASNTTLSFEIEIGMVGKEITLDGSTSSDPFTGQDIEKFEWYINNSLVAETEQHTLYLGEGSHDVVLRVKSITGVGHQTAITIQGTYVTSSINPNDSITPELNNTLDSSIWPNPDNYKVRKNKNSYLAKSNLRILSI